MNTVLFDLDGTLLLMEQEAFVNRYIGLLCKKAAEHGFDPKPIADALWQGTYAMVKNDGTVKNRERFWQRFAEILGEDIRSAEPIFNEFYGNEFNLARDVAEENPRAKEAVELLKAKGYTVALATNPLFPPVAVESRLGWLGLKSDDFAHITNYENSHYCKPNLDYFREVLQVLDKQPADCLMVGNNLREDMCAAQLGMQVYLVTNYLENAEEGAEIPFPQGSFAELLDYLRSLPQAQ